MAEELRILFDSAIFSRPLTSMDVPVSTATASAGYEVTRAFDGTRASQWVVPSPGSTVECRFGGGAARTLGGNGGGGLYLGVGVANHNLHSCGLDSITVATSASGTGGAYADLVTLPAIGSDNDHVYQIASAPNVRSYRLTFNFGSDPGIAMRIGHIQVGSLYAFTGASGHPEPQEIPFDSSLIELSSSHDLASGGRLTIARPNVYEIMTFSWATASETTRAALRSIVVASRMGLYPIMVHTHRHTGGDAWTDAGGSPDVEHGGAYIGAIEANELRESLRESRVETALALRRERSVFVQ